MIKLLRSKINLLNANIAQYHDCGMFSTEEIVKLNAPILLQVQECQEKIIELKAREYEVVDAEALTPLKQASKL